MNLHITHPDPSLCAMALDDRRVREMVGRVAFIFIKFSPFKITYFRYIKTDNDNWAQENNRNLSWLLEFHIALAGELTYRFPEEKPNRVFMKIGYEYQGLLKAKPQPLSFPSCPSNDMDLTSLEVHYTYRAYLRYLWATDELNPIWTLRPPPVWLVEDTPREALEYPYLRSLEICWRKSGDWVRITKPCNYGKRRWF